jgi:hypothetical protein
VGAVLPIHSCALCTTCVCVCVSVCVSLCVCVCVCVCMSGRVRAFGRGQEVSGELRDEQSHS